MAEQFDSIDVTQELKLVGKTSVIFGFSQILLGITGIVISFLVAKILGSAQLGIYSLAITIAIFASQISTFGLQAGVIKFIPHHIHKNERPKVKGVITASFAFTLELSLIIGAILFLSADYIAGGIFQKPTLSMPLKITSFAVPLVALYSLVSATLRAFKMITYQSLMLLVQKALLLVFVLAAIFIGAKLIGIIISAEASFAIAALTGGAILLKKRFSFIGNTRTEHVLPSLFKYSFLMLLSYIAAYFIVSADILMLGYFKALSDVGVYKLSAAFAGICVMPVYIINIVHAPLISEFHAKDEPKKMKAVATTLTRWVFMVSLPAFLMLILYAGRLLGFFGKDFPGGMPALVILAFAQLISASTGSVSSLLAMTKYPHLDLLNNVTLLALALILNFILIPPFGIVGAATATGISIVFVNILRLAEVSIIFGFSPYNLKFLKPLAAGLIAFGASQFMISYAKLLWQSHAWFVLPFAFGLIYAGILFALKFEREDSELLSWAITRIKQKAG
ncbi:MAG: flippase [Candidatus Omnitrophica bacterium]|nr:flippase [Candidatus Omnitrophota bacterium]